MRGPSADTTPRSRHILRSRRQDHACAAIRTNPENSQATALAHAGNVDVEPLQIQMRRKRPRRNAKDELVLGLPLQLIVRDGEGKRDRVAAVADRFGHGLQA
eukprot:5476034-Pyramimonas_sp.AAC.2